MAEESERITYQQFLAEKISEYRSSTLRFSIPIGTTGELNYLLVYGQNNQRAIHLSSEDSLLRARGEWQRLTEEYSSGRAHYGTTQHIVAPINNLDFSIIDSKISPEEAAHILTGKILGGENLSTMPHESDWVSPSPTPSTATGKNRTP